MGKAGKTGGEHLEIKLILEAIFILTWIVLNIFSVFWSSFRLWLGKNHRTKPFGPKFMAAFQQKSELNPLILKGCSLSLNLPLPRTLSFEGLSVERSRLSKEIWWFWVGVITLILGVPTESEVKVDCFMSL